MEVNISDLTWDQFINPRGGKSEKTINAYVEALEIGAQFPPIKIQRVFNYAHGLKRPSQKNSGLASRPSIPGSRISVPGRKQTGTALSSACVALDGPRKRSQKQWG